MLYFNNTRGKGIEFNELGLKSVRLFTAWAFFEYDNQNKKYLFENGYKREKLENFALRHLKNEDLAVLDIEHLKHDISRYSSEEVQASLKTLIKVVEDFHEIRPDKRTGFYRLLPIRNFFAPVNKFCNDKTNPKYSKFLDDYNNWRKANSFIKYVKGENKKSFNEVVDFVAPSLYTFYRNLGLPIKDDIKMNKWWPIYAKENINEARRYKKDVYVYLMREYHPGGFGGKSDIAMIPEDVEFQLSVLKKLKVDGVIFFSMNEFGPDDLWWNTVKDFISKN